MADAVLLSQETFNHLKKWLDDYGNGLKDTLQFGKGLSVEERGTDYIKVGIVKDELNDITGSCIPTAPPSSGTWVWGTVDGVCQWIETTTCS